ncbi:hypothetical protein P4S63_20450 [Pseudoalteromonas sp. B193]
MSDRVRNRDFFDANESEEGVTELRRVDVMHEEREMFSTQIKGTHNFPELENLFLIGMQVQAAPTGMLQVR